MTYTDAVVVLEGMIKTLESHIELAQKGLIQEDCIGCREKDLETYKGILQVLEKEHNDKNGWHMVAMEWPLKIDKLSQAFEIIKKCINSNEIYRNMLKERFECGWINQEEFDLAKEVLESCPDSKIAE